MNILCFIIIFLLSAATKDTFPAANIQTQEQVTYDWAQNGRPYHFVLDQERKHVAIYQDNILILTISNSLPFSKYSDEVYGPFRSFIRFNMLESDYLLAVYPYRNALGYPLIFLFGSGVASTNGSLHILSLQSDGIPIEALYVEEYNLRYIEDINDDDIDEVIGYPCMIESGFGIEDAEGTYESYRPYRVYKWREDKQVLEYSLSLSKQYTTDHYYGWAGPECSEEYLIELSSPTFKGKKLVSVKQLKKRR